MEALECLHSRRSIRKYTDTPISDADLKVLLDAAMAAPSAGNAQPWHFVVVRDKALLEQVHAFNPYAAMLGKAALGILVCADTREEKYPGYWVQDCSAATQNLLLAATALGLGGVWTGVHPISEREEGCRKLFKLPPEVRPLGLVALGHPEKKGEKLSRYNEAKIHSNIW